MEVRMKVVAFNSRVRMNGNTAILIKLGVERASK
jgi:hypothetical protein